MYDLLKKLNLTEKEILVIKALYELGKATPSVLSKRTGMNRSTVYVIKEELKQKGFIREDMSARKQTLIPLHPDELLGLIPIMEKEFEDKKSTLTALVDTLNKNLKNRNVQIPQILYIPEEQMEAHLYARTPIWNQSMFDTETDFVGYQDHTYVELFTKQLEWYWKQPSSKSVNLKLISNENIYEKEVMQKKDLPRRKILFWNGIGDVTFTTWIMGDYVVLINTRKYPYNLIEIFNPEFAKSQREIFEVMWKEANKIVPTE